MQIHVERLKVKSIPRNSIFRNKQLGVYFNTSLLVVDIRSNDKLPLPSSFLLGDVFPDGNRIDKDVDVVDHHLAEMFLVKHGESMHLANNFAFQFAVTYNIHLLVALNLAQQYFIEHQLHIFLEISVEMNVETLDHTFF